MNFEQKIQVNRILLDREVGFQHVYDLEQQINNVLGADYPFAVPELCSLKKRRKAGAKPKRSAKISIRKLAPEETGYRIRFSHAGAEHEQQTDSLGLVKKLLTQAESGLEVLEIIADGPCPTVLYPKG